MRALTLAVAALLLLFPAPSDSQTVAPDPGQPSIGAKVGINVASISSDIDDTDSKIGLIGGGFVRWPLEGAFSVQPEVLISQQGAKYMGATGKVTYLQIPVLALASFPAEAASPFVFAGPALGLKLGSSVEYEDVSVDVDDEISGTDFSLVFGGGVEVGRFSAEARYSLGIKNIDGTGLATEKNRVLSVLVGYRFPWSR